LLADVSPRLSGLTLRVSDTCRGCSVFVDERPWPSAALGVAVPVDPGAHIVRLMQETRIVTRRGVQLQPGERIAMMLGAPAPPLAPRSPPSPQVAAAPAAHPSTSDETIPGPVAATQSDGSVWSSPWLWGAVGVVVAAAMATVVIAAASQSEKAAPAVPGNLTPAVIEVRP
jgi:hypothetical protein